MWLLMLILLKGVKLGLGMQTSLRMNLLLSQRFPTLLLSQRRRMIGSLDGPNALLSGHALSTGLRRKLTFPNQSLMGLRAQNWIFSVRLKRSVLVGTFGWQVTKACIAPHAWVCWSNTVCCRTWKSSLHCLALGQELKWTGCGHPLLHKVHFTHAMDGTESTLTCRSCGARLTGHCTGAQV